MHSNTSPLAAIEVGDRHRSDVLKEALVVASGSVGAVKLTGYFDADQLRRMGYEARRASLAKRKISDWHNTSRATFFPERDRSSRSLSLASSILLRSDVWMPVTDALASGMAHSIRDFGRKEGCESLAQYRPNRIGVNVLYGTQEDPALIPKHTDVAEEKGLVAAIELGDGYTTQAAGTLTLILGKDTCKRFGIEQHFHEVTSETKRYGITVAQLVL